MYNLYLEKTFLEDVAGLDSGEHGQKGPDVPLRPGGPEGLRVEALEIHVAKVHDEGGGNLKGAGKAAQRQVSVLLGVTLLLYGIASFLDRYGYLTTQNNLFTGVN